MLATITGGLGRTTNSDLLHALLNQPAKGDTNTSDTNTSDTNTSDTNTTGPNTSDPGTVVAEAISVTTIELGDTAESLRVWV